MQSNIFLKEFKLMTHLSSSATLPLNSNTTRVKLITGRSVCTGSPSIVALPAGAAPVMANSTVNGVARLTLNTLPLRLGE